MELTGEELRAEVSRLHERYNHYSQRLRNALQREKKGTTATLGPGIIDEFAASKVVLKAQAAEIAALEAEVLRLNQLVSQVQSSTGITGSPTLVASANQQGAAKVPSANNITAASEAAIQSAILARLLTTVGDTYEGAYDVLLRDLMGTIADSPDATMHRALRAIVHVMATCKPLPDEDK